MKQLIERLKSKTPLFFKQLQRIMATVGASGAAVMVANNSLNLTIDAGVIRIVSYVIVICAAVIGTAQFAKEDKR